MVLKQVFYPNLTTVFDNSSGPEAFTFALIDELVPVIEFLKGHLSVSDDESVKWILMELTANAATAPISYTLGRETGLTRDEMLTAIGTSALWPDLSARSLSGSSQESVVCIEQVLGISIPEWLSLRLKDRICLLGLTPESNWVQIRVDIDVQQDCFSLSVVTSFPPLKEDIEAIRCRFETPDETTCRIRKERAAFEDEEGIYHMPSFTGGGGMGLLACIRLAEKKNLYLDYFSQDLEESGIRFRISNHPIR
ncbi:hypothetical protein DRQ25_03895 [Candidatus Fermentibacteria bacterium]|nr:MAG: hypothetical protein DRQ25_03895 [Candidatus Fermentibacteria bacterium]